MNLLELHKKIIKKYPLTLQDKWDISGIVVPFAKNEQITGVLICLDVNSETIEFASNNNINVIVSHHPVFVKTKNGKTDKDALAIIDKLKKNKLALLSYHTNVDNSQYGLSYHVAKELGLSNIKQIGNTGIVIGSLRFPYRPRVLSAVLIKSFDLNKVMFNEDLQSKHLAICAGAGFNIFKENLAKLPKIDLYITGDVKWHDWQYAKEHKMNVMDVGHDLENIFINAMLKVVNADDDVHNVRSLPSKSEIKIVN